MAISAINTSNTATTRQPVTGLRMYFETLSFKTRERLELINITRNINETIRKHDIRAGLALIHTLHTTTALFINEFQEALLGDMKCLLEKVVGRFDYWRHNDPRLSDCDRQNADSHLRGMLLGHTLSLPVRNGELSLGCWQSVILAELDGPRDRALQVQMIGSADGTGE